MCATVCMETTKFRNMVQSLNCLPLRAIQFEITVNRLSTKDKKDSSLALQTQEHGDSVKD